MDLEPYVDAKTGETINCVQAGDRHVERAISTELTGVRRCVRCGYAEPTTKRGSE